jgi:hypothetical protein
MKPHEPTAPIRIKCEVCGKPMQLKRTALAPSRGESFEFYECVCGHTHLRARQMERKSG